VRLDARSVVSVLVDVTDLLSNESIAAKIAEQVTASGAVTADLVHIELIGEAPPGMTVVPPARLLEGRFFHIQFEFSAVCAAYDLAQYAAPGAADTSEGRFVRRLLADLAAAEAAGDSERARTVRLAIEYGLDALSGNTVRPRGLGPPAPNNGGV
jgi:hypothetical protein